MRKDVYSMKATIEREGCISCGLCAETCPAVFYIADDGRADIKQDPTRKLWKPAWTQNRAAPSTSSR